MNAYYSVLLQAVHDTDHPMWPATLSPLTTATNRIKIYSSRSEYTAVLLYRQLVSAGTSCDSCLLRDIIKRTLQLTSIENRARSCLIGLVR